jgi:NitT/TauT family transport system ATP-binding protein
LTLQLSQLSTGVGGDYEDRVIIQITNVTHRFGAPEDERAPWALVDIDLDLRSGELVALVGPSGCGKTTLLNMVAGLENPVAGEVLVAGHEPKLGDPAVSYVLARDALMPWRTALGNVALGMEVQGVPRKERVRRAAEMLNAMGLGGFENYYPAQLSHGMRQRVALARALATEPTIVLLDEPFSALDAQTRLTLQDNFLRAWEERRQTALLVTHDLNEAIGMADRVVIMTRSPGRIKSVHHVDFPRPRRIIELQSNDDFGVLYRTLWSELGEEVIEASGSGETVRF